MGIILVFIFGMMTAMGGLSWWYAAHYNGLVGTTRFLTIISVIGLLFSFGYVYKNGWVKPNRHRRLHKRRMLILINILLKRVQNLRQLRNCIKMSKTFCSSYKSHTVRMLVTSVLIRIPRRIRLRQRTQSTLKQLPQCGSTLKQMLRISRRCPIII